MVANRWCSSAGARSLVPIAMWGGQILQALNAVSTTMVELLQQQQQAQALKQQVLQHQEFVATQQAQQALVSQARHAVG